MLDSNRHLDTSDEEIDHQPSSMSDERIDQIYKALRLVPEFNGNPNVLTRFVNLCDQLVKQFVKEGDAYQLSNLSLINGILNKVTGPASATINSNGIPENWSDIRKILINNFADHRDETSLYNDLSLLTQGSGTPQEFYEQCQNLFSIIMTYISLNETVQSTIEAKRALYKKLTLQSYLRGLRDPLGSRIRCMRPDTIEKALEFVHEEMNTLYLQQRNDNLPDKKFQSTSSFNQPRLSYNTPAPVALPPRPFSFQPPRPFNMPGPSRPFNMPAIAGPSKQFPAQPQRPMHIWKPQQPLQTGPTRTQQMFAAPPPNYRPQNNVFRMPQKSPNIQSNNANNASTPMSGVSHYVTKPMPMRTPHDWSRFGNPPPSNYFKSREINFNESYDNYGQYEPYNDYYDVYQQDYYEYPDFACAPYEHQYYYQEYVPVSVEEAQDEVPPTGNEDFQQTSKSEKPK